MQPTTLPTDQLLTYLDSPAAARQWLSELGVRDLQRAHGNLVRLAESRLTIDLLTIVCQQLTQHLPALSDPDRALNNLQRYVEAARNPLALGALFERDADALPILLTIFSSSQFLSDDLVRDPEGYDLLRMTDGQPVAREVLTKEILAEVEALPDERSALAVLRRIKRREMLRIAYGDLIREQSIEVVTRQISILADALCSAALQAAYRKLNQRHGWTLRSDGQRCRFVVLALGKLGGEELNYSSDIDLLFLYEEEGRSDGEKSIDNREYFDRLGQQLIKLLTEATDLGGVYRVDMRLRPEGRDGPITRSVNSALGYYDVMGRTWERQAFVKARSVAGDLDLGQEFLSQLEPWIWRRYLTRADITGIKALKRRIERRARTAEGDRRNVKTGHGGIRDVEFAIQFLQLLNGGDLPDIRTGNTLQAIMALERDGCLTYQERTILEDNYAFLRKIEHRLQIMFDLQTHDLPEQDDELRKLARRMGFSAAEDGDALSAFQEAFTQRTDANRKILDHLLHDAFGEQETIEPEVDLILDPNPADETIAEVMGKYHFRDSAGAYRNLMALAREQVRFLSTRRCRHFLASIAPRLLQAIDATPDPDGTLINLVKVSDSLGGKAVLWELFSFNQPTLDLYVRLCGVSNYLANILTSHPGMIDELLDSLLLEKLPSRQTLEAVLHDLTRGAEDLMPIVHSFKNSQHLRVGVRDILGKDDIEQTHATLADIAEVILREVAAIEFRHLEEKYGQPSIGEGARQGDPCELIILAMGKMGGREPNYHSDLDVVFLYEAEGTTKAIRPSQKSRTTSNQHFFSELGQRIITTVNQVGPQGRLYELDPRLRPTGGSGPLAVSLTEFERYFSHGQGKLWERQALCKARPIFGSAEAGKRAMEIAWQAIVHPPWHSRDAAEIRHMRQRLEETASEANLKRGRGGTVDIEFAVQMLQMKHAAKDPDVLQPGTLAALTKLHESGHLRDEDFELFDRSYRFLRNIESHLRLMNTTARHDLPTDPAELNKLAWLLKYPSGEELAQETTEITQATRACFDRVFDAAAG